MVECNLHEFIVMTDHSSAVGNGALDTRRVALDLFRFCLKNGVDDGALFKKFGLRVENDALSAM